MPPRLLHRVPAGLPAFLGPIHPPCYVHRAPQWQVTALVGTAAALVGAGLAYIAWQGWQRDLTAPEWAMGAFMIPFLLLLLRPVSWRSPVVLVADVRGIHFLGGRESAFVPWAETGPLSIERARTQAGVARCVIVTIASSSPFWEAARQSAFSAWLMGDEQPPGYFRMPIVSQGVAPAQTLACLEALREQGGKP
ncbi:MAG TPA: hypothetical protein PK347_11050 [Burkholderiaceae bacterium]|nr:hypothetical protein [Burkholderiaceae bacterium]